MTKLVVIVQSKTLDESIVTFKESNTMKLTTKKRSLWWTPQTSALMAKADIVCKVEFIFSHR